MENINLTQQNTILENEIDENESYYASAAGSVVIYTAGKGNFVSIEKHKDNKWYKNKKFYYAFQILCLSSNILCSLSVLGLSIWLSVDDRFRFLAKLANDITYSSVNLQFFDNLLSLCYYIAIISLAINLIFVILFIKSRNFLENYPNNANLHKNMKPFISRVKSYKAFASIITYTSISLYGFFIIVFELYIFVWFRCNQYELVNNDIPSTLWKLVKEYEIHKDYIEEDLVIRMQKSFDCCHYSSPFQFGPEICNQERACLVPIQFYTFNLSNTLVLFYLLNFILNIIFQILHLINFKEFFVRKLLYSYKSFKN
jgi:hypothetical protein